MRIVLFLFAMFIVGSCKFYVNKTSNNTKEYLLSGETSKFWIADYGLSMLIRADGILEEYVVRQDGTVEKPDFGDVLVDYTEWKVVGDTLKIGYGHQYMKFFIFKISASHLTLLSPPYGSSDTIRYMPARPNIYPKRYHSSQYTN